MDNLAVAQQALDEYAEAKVLHERALRIRERVLGPDHVRVAASLHNLAGVHRHSGEHSTARDLERRALVIFERVRGPEHPDVALARIALGASLRALEDYEGAKASYTLALASREKRHGSSHPELAPALLGLAEVALDQHREDEAMELAHRIVAVLSSVNADDPMIVRARAILASK